MPRQAWVKRLLARGLVLALVSGVVAGPTVACGEELDARAASNNLALHCPVSFDPAPNYPSVQRGAEDLTVLTDGHLCEGQEMMWLQPGTVGWSLTTPAAMTVDLGKMESISGVALHLAAGAANTEWPVRILILTSDDGKDFYDAGDLVAMSRQAMPKPGYATHWYSTNRLQTHGRFVKFMIESAGDARYIVADEVEVRQGDAPPAALPFAGAPVGDATAYFWQTGVQRRVGLRLARDLKSARARVAATAQTIPAGPFLARLKDLEARLTDPAALALPGGRAILPLNGLHREIMAAHGQYLGAHGLPPLMAEPSNPWDYLDFVRVPNHPADSPARVALMRGETRPVTINLTNATAQPMVVHFGIEGFPPEAGLQEVYEIVWTDTEVATPVASAMHQLQPEANGYATAIPAGMTRQVWLNFKPGQRAPGRWQGWLNSLGWFGFKPGEGAKGMYHGQLVAHAAGNISSQVPIAVQVFNRDFPSPHPTLHMGGWDYTDADQSFGITPQNRAQVIALLQAYGVDRTWGSPHLIGRGQYDAQGNLTVPPDMSRFNHWLERWPKAKQYLIHLAVPNTLGKFERAGPEFNRAVAQWTAFVAKHAISRGLQPDQVMLLLVDEPHTDAQAQLTIDWAHAI
ncbi:MAG: hypothetical protein WCP45_18725, partial [Verrucomicrobiota bacterium]